MEIQEYSNQWAGRQGESAVPTNNLIALRFTRTLAESLRIIVVTESKPGDIASLFETVIWASLFLSGISAVLMAFLL